MPDSIAKAAGASAADVNITNIGTMGSINGRRQQAAAVESIRIGISIKAYSEAAANSIAQALTPDKINEELAKVGLPKAFVLEAAKVAAGDANPERELKKLKNPKAESLLR